MELKTEIFVPINGYNGRYEVSNHGRIKSLKRKVLSRWGKYRTIPEIILKPKTTRTGYHSVSLCIKQKHSTFSVHQLVATHFIPNPDSKPHVNHIDTNKINNCVWNLEWNTALENMTHAIAHGLVPKMKPPINRGIKAYNHRPIIQFDLLGNKVKEWGFLSEASTALGYCRSNIIACCKGRKAAYNGFVWKYKN